MKSASLVLMIAVVAAPLRGDTCLAPKNPVKASAVCGRVIAPDGSVVPNIELQLVRGDEIVAKVESDSTGHFMFGTVPIGDYDLTTKAQGWYLWPVTVMSAKVRTHCGNPMTVQLSLKMCGQSVTRRGYHAKF